MLPPLDCRNCHHAAVLAVLLASSYHCHISTTEALLLSVMPLHWCCFMVVPLLSTTLPVGICCGSARSFLHYPCWCQLLLVTLSLPVQAPLGDTVTTSASSSAASTSCLHYLTGFIYTTSVVLMFQSASTNSAETTLSGNSLPTPQAVHLDEPFLPKMARGGIPFFYYQAFLSP